MRRLSVAGSVTTALFLGWLLGAARLNGTPWGCAVAIGVLLVQAMFLQLPLRVAAEEYGKADKDVLDRIPESPVKPIGCDRWGIALLAIAAFGLLFAGALALSPWNAVKVVAWLVAATLSLVLIVRGDCHLRLPGTRPRHKVSGAILAAALVLAVLHFLTVFLVFVFVFKQRAIDYAFATLPSKISGDELAELGRTLWFYPVAAFVLAGFGRLRGRWRIFAVIQEVLAFPTVVAAIAVALNLSPVLRRDFPAYSLIMLGTLTVSWFAALRLHFRRAGTRRIHSRLCRYVFYSSLAACVMTIVCGIITYGPKATADGFPPYANELCVAGFVIAATAWLICFWAAGLQVYYDRYYPELRQPEKPEFHDYQVWDKSKEASDDQVASQNQESSIQNPG